MHKVVLDVPKFVCCFLVMLRISKCAETRP